METNRISSIFIILYSSEGLYSALITISMNLIAAFLNPPSSCQPESQTCMHVDKI